MKHEGNRLDYLSHNNPRKFRKIFKHRKCTRSQLTIIIPVNLIELDSYFSDDEVARVLNGLKCGEATGLDYLLNEYFVKFKDIFQPLLVHLFNCILDSSAFPRIWSRGTIVPLHKKGRLMILITIEKLP